MSAVLLRTDGSGEALQLDGVVGYRGAPGVLVAQHPVQRLGVVVDHAQRLATSFGVEWVVSMRLIVWLRSMQPVKWLARL